MRNKTLTFLFCGSLALIAGCNKDRDQDGYRASEDCDDFNIASAPGNEEICDGIDNDCDGEVDEADSTNASIWFADLDGDGYGDPESTQSACSRPTSHVDNDSDCDDSAASAYPGATEYCDELDNDCDGETDEEAVDSMTYYLDGDGDGYGRDGTTITGCSVPDGYAAEGGDCDDGADAVNPGASEICNEGDDDCDGEIDEDATDASMWYADSDFDGYGDPDNAVASCTAPSGYIADNQDCDDTYNYSFPGADEVCDGLDNDCDPTTSEAGLIALDGIGGYARIQGALDSAVEGSYLAVCEGVWSESLTISTSNVTLWAPAGADLTTIQGDGTSATIVVDAFGSTDSDMTVISGFTVSGGDGFYGGGIDASSTEDDLWLEDLQVTDNSAIFGGGFFSSFYADTTVMDVDIERNTASQYGGGALFFNTVSLEDVAIIDNSAEVAGGMYLEYAEVSATDLLVASNYASAAGGGAILSDATLSGGEFSNNTSEDIGGGIATYNSAIDGVTVSANRAFESGGIDAYLDLELTNSTITGNTSLEAGGGVSLVGATGLFENVSITDNTAGTTGGGLYVDESSVLLTTCDVTGNSAAAGGGVHLLEDSDLESDSSNWGTSTDGDDNDPDDLYVDGVSTAYTDYGSAESFVCDDNGCN